MDVAIVGMGCRFPGGADSPGAFWELLRAGVDAVGELPADRYDLGELFDPDPGAPGKIYTRWGGYLDRVDTFDADFFGISPREARRMDPQQRLLLEVVWEACEQGGQVPQRLAGTGTGVFVGISTRDYVDVQDLPHNRHRIDPHLNSGIATSIAANRVSYLLDLRGPSLAVDTACSSSLTAVHLACRSLAAGDCDSAIVGGVGLLLAPEGTIGFCKASMLSPDGRCRAFDAGANGYVRSEGAGAVLLKPLERAVAEGDPIQAVILGSAINEDGRTTGLSLPSASAQEAMLRQALRDAGVAAGDIAYVEAHGTGTAAGDPIEAEAMGRVLGADRSADEPCLIGSVKTNLGHLEAAAGMSGLIKTILALQHRQIPPNLHFASPNPAIAFDELRLRVPTTLESWPSNQGRALAGVNSFGFGGANAHVVLAEAPPTVRSRPTDDDSAHILTLSARGSGALRDLAGRYHHQLGEDRRSPLRDLCFSAAVRRTHHPDRLAIVGRSRAEMREHLGSFLEGSEGSPWALGRAPSGHEPRLAFVFTGMGPQWWGMGRRLLESEPMFRDTVSQVDALLRPLSGWSLLDALAAPEESSRVGDADVAHVANLAIQMGLAAMWRSWGIVPDAIVGHSSGEMAAACVAGALALPDAVHLAFHRGRLQHRTTGTGRMLAAAISAEEAATVISGLHGQVGLAAVNSGRSVTLSGTEEALAGIAASLTAEKKFARFLAVNVPYHGPQMEELREEFLDAVGGLHSGPTDTPLVSVVTGSWIDGCDLDAGYWWRNIRQPVQFATAADHLIEDGCELFVEIGPHPVLGPALSECFAAHHRTATVLPSLRRADDDCETMARSLAAMHVRGRSVDWAARYPGGTCVALPSYPWQRERHWFDSDEDPTPVARGLVGVDTGHPLLGRRLPSAQPTWEADLDGPDTAYLDAHVVQDAALFPGAGYVEMALAAARQLWGQGPVMIEEIEFRKLLFLRRPRRAAVQAIYHPRDGGFEIHSDSAGDGATWTLHTTATLTNGGAPEQNLDLEGLLARCPSTLTAEEHYELLEQRGYRFGREFRTLREIWLGDGQAVGRVANPGGVDFAVGDHQAHPALLDAALQLFGAASTAAADVRPDAPFFPVSIRRLGFSRHLTEPCWAHVVVRHHDDTVIEGDAWLFDDTGEVTITLEGIRLQVLDEHRPAPAIDDWLYELRWEPVPLTTATGGSGMPSVAQVRSAVEDRHGPPQDTDEVARYLDPVEPCLDTVARGFTLAALTSLGWTDDHDHDHDHTASADHLADTLGIVPGHQQLFAALLAMISGGHDERPRDVPRDHPTLHRMLDELIATQPDCAPEAELLRRGGTRLADILRGHLDAREVLLSGESLGLLSRLYHTSPSFQPYHKLLAQAVAASLEDRPTDSGPLRVLEIGAGTGAATNAVLPHLPETAEYVFTDISRHFLVEARQHFGHRQGLRFEVLDIETDPAEQGFSAHSFDLVIAANVVHATAELDTTLGNVRRLLAEGGILALLELTRQPDWLNLVFGLLEGWWRSADTHRLATGPTLESPRWQDLLERSEFEQVSALFSDEADDRALQTVLLASAPATPPPDPAGEHSARHWLVFADEAGVAPSISDVLRRRGDRCTHVHPGPAYHRHDDGSFALPPTEVASYTRLFDDLSDEQVDGVVHLWSIDTSSGNTADTAELMDRQQFGCGSVLALMQALDAAAGAPELWLVTAGAQAVPDHDSAPNVGQSPLWGLGRVIMGEQAAARCRLIDLGPELAAADTAALAVELSGAGVDEEVALRGDVRLARRLRRTTLSDHARRDDQRPADPATDGFRLEIDAPGALESLVLRQAPLAEPGPGELSIRVRASGLNFRDVLQALDMLPAAAYQHDPDPVGLGIECAGIVEACGEGVERFRPGDEVIALAAAAHGTRVVARQHLTVPKPAELSFEEAASVLNAFATAEYALNHVAAIAEGERVLIHSATGAVGLAAIQLCRRVGAEIFATAGTPRKRSYLSDELGIDHVMDSRSLAFAEEVLAATGGEGVDVVLNSLSGEATVKGLSVLRPYGRFVELGKRDIFADARIGLAPFQRNLSFHAVDLIQLALDRPEQVQALVEHVVGEIDGRLLHVVPTTAFDIAEAEQAFRLMAQARHIGKVVLSVDDPQYPVRPPIDAPLFNRNGTYLITGGTGGFGLSVAEWMAREGAGSLVLLSRTGTPKDNTEALEALYASAAQVTVVTGDVSSRDDVGHVLDRIRRDLPPLKGVVHAAMVLDDDVLVRLDQQRFTNVLAPKVAGGWNLHQLTEEDDLDMFVLFSSLAAVVGHPMQANYAAANAFLDALTPHRHARGLPSLTIGWGAVSGVGYVSRHPELADHLDRAGFHGLSPQQALDILGELLHRDAEHVIAASMDWRKWASINSLSGASRRFREFVTDGDGLQSGQSNDGSASPLSLVRDAAPADRLAAMTDYLRSKVARVLGTTADRVDAERPLTEQGFDSLMAVELTTTFANDLGLQMAVVDILQGPTGTEVAETLLVELNLGSGAGELLAPDTPDDVARTEPSGDAAQPLSFEQRRFWFLDRLDPDNTAYNLPAAARLTGHLDTEALQRSLSEVTRRHDMLRAVIGVDDGEPVQWLRPPEPVPLPIVDLRHLREDDRSAELARVATEEIGQPFDLGTGPLLRGRLFRLDDDEHVMVLVVHHIACDAWAMNLLVREIGLLYGAFSEGQPSPLAEPPRTYLDYIKHQRARLDEVVGAQLDYWEHELAGSPTALRLPAAPALNAAHRGRGAHRSIELPRDLTAQLQALSSQEGVTLFMTLLAAFQTLLHRYSHDDDICVGTAVSTRNQPGDDTVVGCFINTVVLRTDLSGEPTFRQLLQRVKATTLGALANQDVPFDRVVEALQPHRDQGRSPLFEAMLILHNARFPELRVGALDVGPMEVESGTAVADLVLLLDAGERLGGMLEYNADRFAPATIDSLLDHFRSLLAAVTADPDQQLSAVPLLSEAERRAMLVDWNDTATDFGGDVCLHHLVEAQVDRSPDATAVVSGSRSVSYRNLDQRANQLAHRLQGLGVGPDVVVGVYLPRSVTAVVAALGILKAGGAYLPLDPEQPAGRVGRMITDARAAVLLTPPELMGSLPECTAQIVTVDDGSTEADQAPIGRPVGGAEPTDLAYVIYTSGSTGAPKGVEVPHRAISNQVQWRQHAFPLSNTDTVLQRTPVGFDPSVWEVFGPLTAGAKLVIPPPGADSDSPGLVRLLADQQVTTVQVVPSLLRVLLDHPAIEHCRSLRLVLCGGEPMPIDLPERFRSHLSAELHNLYGPTEAAIDATHWDCRDRADRSVVPIGGPIANARVHILDAHLEPVPVGVPGEVHIGGVGVARGYRNQRELTEERFVDDPFTPGERLYRTGDIGYRLADDGAIVLIGRSDTQLKVRGVRVEPAEIESVLADHPKVREAVVVPWEDRSSEVRLAAFVATEEGTTAAELQWHAAERLPDVMVPTTITVLDSLARTHNGKVDRNELLRQRQVERSEPAVAPRDVVELELLRIWEKVLPATSVGVTDDFFQVGGHSLLAMEVVARVEREFGRELAVSSLLEGRTIEQLAGILREPDGGRRSPLVTIQPNGDERPWFWVHAVGGTVFSYVELARALGQERPFHGFEAVGLSGGEPHTRIEDMAGEYVAELQRLQPSGPYLLGGWSMGGVIAFEMARQLEGRDHRVALTVMLDPSHPTAKTTDGVSGHAPGMLGFVRHLGLTPDELTVSMADFWQLDREQQLVCVLEHARRARLVPSDLGMSGLRRQANVFASNLRAMHAYSPGSYAGRVALICAEQSRVMGTDPGPKWEGSALGGVVRHTTPGDHYTMLHAPHVDVLARRLTACLDEIDSAGSRREARR